MNNTDGIQLVGEVVMKAVGKDGRVLWEWQENNLVVTLGKTNMVKLLGGAVDGLAVTKIGVGDSGTAAAPGDTGLSSPFLKNLNTDGTVNTYTSNTVTFGYKIDDSEAVGLTVREVGLFNSASVLVARKVLGTPITKTGDFALTGTWTLRVV